MMKCIEFKDMKKDVHKGIYQRGRIRNRKVGEELISPAIDQLNEYLQQNDQEIDLIEIQKHSDSYLLVYRVITESERFLMSERG